MATIRRIYRWIFNSAAALTGALIVSILVIAVPQPGQPRSGAFKAWLFLLVVQWTSLSLIVAVRLWRGGRGHPNVAKRRMQTLAIGALGMAVAAVVGATFGVRVGVGVAQILTQALGLVSAPLFLAGFAPPGILLAFWRRHQQAAVRETTIGLMKASTRDEVTSVILPQASALLGGRGACLIDRRSVLVGSFGLTVQELDQFVNESPSWRGISEVVSDKGMVRVPLEHGWLVMVPSDFAPFFGDEETKLLKSIAVFVDMALGRVDLAFEERKNLETMRDFVAIAAHDLRTPVTLVTGFAKLLTSEWAELEESEKLEMVRSIERQGGRLTNLTEDLLLLSRIETEGVDAHPSNVFVKHAIARTVRDLSADYSAVVELKIDPELMVYVDPDHFTRMISHFLTNAYIYGKPPFCVEAFASEEGIRIVVKDQGVGVPREFTQSLFGKFARADKKTSKASDGTGLGLSIVRGLALAAGGRAWYEPNSPHGAAFMVELPRVAA